MDLSTDECLGCSSSMDDSILNFSSTSGTPVEEKDDNEFNFQRYLWIYVAPITFIVGIIGNLLIMLVMRRRRMWGSTASVYLLLIALFDSLTLICGMIPEWMEYADIVVFKEIHPATCKLEKFLFYTVADIAIWLLLAFTADRFMAVCFPLIKRKVCLMSRAYMSAIFIMCLAIVKNFHVFWTRGPEYKENDEGELFLKKICGRPTEAYKYFEYHVRPWIVLAVVNVIPLVAITSFNVAIIVTLVLVSKKSQFLEPGKAGTDKKVKRTYSQTTVMCIAASVLFLVCITPSIVILIGRPWWQEDNAAYDVSKALSNQIVYLNHSLNIILYCLTGRRFRQEMVDMFKRKKSGASPYQPGAQSGYSVRIRNTIKQNNGTSVNKTDVTNLSSRSPVSSTKFDSEYSQDSIRTGRSSNTNGINSSESTL